jgi:hypothetical protein
MGSESEKNRSDLEIISPSEQFVINRLDIIRLKPSNTLMHATQFLFK